VGEVITLEPLFRRRDGWCLRTTALVQFFYGHAGTVRAALTRDAVMHPCGWRHQHQALPDLLRRVRVQVKHAVGVILCYEAGQLRHGEHFLEQPDGMPPDTLSSAAAAPMTEGSSPTPTTSSSPHTTWSCSATDQPPLPAVPASNDDHDHGDDVEDLWARLIGSLATPAESSS
jgi:hypothetical protein